MTESRHDAGVLMVLLERLEKRRIPNAVALKNKVDRGSPLSDYDIEFMAKVLTDIKKTEPLLARNPEYQTLIDRLAHLYKEISVKALENEKRSG